MISSQPNTLRFEIVDEPYMTSYQPKKKKSFERLSVNSEHIKEMFSTRPALKKIRFDELELLQDIRNLVESDAEKFQKIESPTEYRRELRASILPKYIDADFIKNLNDKLFLPFIYF